MEDSRSWANAAEESAVAALVVHLVRSGVTPARITVIASYKGQVSAILGERESDASGRPCAQPMPDERLPPRLSIWVQVRRVKERVEKELTGVASGGWPSAHVHGVAAAKQLAAIRKEDADGSLAPHARRAACQQCLSIMETFLKLGEIEKGETALKMARRLVHVLGSAGNQLLESIELPEKCITKLVEQMGAVDHYYSPAKPNELGDKDALSGAIDALKALDGFAAKWRGLGAVSCAAAACSLLTRLAHQVKDAPAKHSDGRVGFLHALGKKGADHLTALASRESVVVSSIDRYQGSENDVVIVSLVRSNDPGDIGFLRERARRVVAQSRARLGMIFVGDRATFAKTKVWATLISKLQSRGRIGAAVPLCCAKHGERGAKQFDVASSERAIHCGVCTERCGELMACGVHRCQQLCHGGTEQHVICRDLVRDVCCAPARHPITRKCFQEASDVVCSACERLERERKEKEKREAAERERRAQIELEKQIEELKRQPAGLVKKELNRTGGDVAEYLAVVDRTEKYVQADHNNPIAVLRVEKLSHPRLEERFHAAKLRLKSGLHDCVARDLFHGTCTEVTNLIAEGGFKLPAWKEDNMFGQGVYFATDSSKSAQEMYTKGSNALLLCDVLLGRSCTIDGLQSDHPLKRHVKMTRHTKSGPRPFLDVDLEKVRTAGFDSVCAPRDGSMATGGVKFDEYIVYDVNQALPKYIVHFGKYGLDVAKTPVVGQGGIMRHPLFPKREFDPNDVMQMHFRVAESQFLRSLSRTAGGQTKLTKVEYVVNPRLVRDFDAQKAEFARKGLPTDVVLAFHGTKSRQVVDDILKDNFNPAFIGSATDAGFYGKGFYFSEFAETSLAYGGNQNMLLCRLLPGKTFDVNHRMDGQSIKQGYNSHRVAKNSQGYGNELVIDNPRQILPCYVLHVGALPGANSS